MNYLKNYAIYKLYPQVVSVVDNQAFDVDGNLVDVNQELVNEEANSQKYKEQRVAEYPSIGDQLDALFKAGVFPADMAAQIQAVKDKYPKA